MVAPLRGSVTHKSVYFTGKVEFQRAEERRTMRERRCVSVFLLFVPASTEPARGQRSVWGAPAVTVT